MVKKKSFLQGALILTISNFITRLIGFVYRIILSNLIGAEGMGIFHLTFPVYMLSLSLVTGGFSVAVSTLVSKQHTGRMDYVIKIVKTTLRITILLSIVISLFLLFTSGCIAKYLLNDTRTYLSLMIFAPALFIISTSSIIRGFFEGMQDVTPNALANIFEQISRVLIVFGIFYFFSGIKIDYSVSSGIAMFGTIAGELFGFLYLSYAYHKELNNIKVTPVKNNYIKEILSISIPLTLNRFVINALTTVDNVLIPQRLISSGLSKSNSIGLFGELTGMAMPLIFFPSIITNSLSVTIIPAISEAFAKGDNVLIKRRAKEAMDIAVILGFGTMAVFSSIPHQIAGLLYKSPHVGNMLYGLSTAIVLIFINQIFTSILNGLNYQMDIFRISIVTSLVRIFMTYIFVAIPSFRINGYIISIFVSYLLMCILNYRCLKKHANIKLYVNTFTYPFIAMLITYLAIKYSYAFLTFVCLGKAMSVLLSIIIGGVIYILVLMYFKVFTLNTLKKIF